ncbi:MAG: ATP-binding protein [Runella sp.]
MQLRTRLTLLFTLITGTILLSFAAVIYLSAKENREVEFYELLRKEALTKANLFFEAKVEAQILQDIYRNNRQTLNEVEVAIYDSTFRLLYHDAVEIDVVKETSDMIREILQKNELYFYQNDWQVVGLKFFFQHQNYIITAAAYDQYGYRKLNNLFQNILIASLLSILVIFGAGRVFSKRAFDPLREMIGKAKQISATNLDLRISSQSSKDELSELAQTFNQMLDRLEKSFDAQKHFVSNLSHEIRTPLAAIVAELELAQNKNLSIEEYKSVISNAQADAKKMVRLSNSLLDLAKANYDTTEISFKAIRVDEVLLDAVQLVQQANADFHVEIHFDYDIENDMDISIKGNQYLLKTAFVNLIENACKFANNKTCKIEMRLSEEDFKSMILLHFKDSGIGIAEKDFHHIFKPFYRGENKTYTDGNGIGLYLTRKIIDIHEGKIHVESKQGQGSVFTVALPVISQ